jgi:hypothetical protein
MAGITLSQAESRLALYLEAEAAVLSAQSYEINGRRLTRADVAEIRAGIVFWENRVNTLTASVAGRTRARTVVASR